MVVVVLLASVAGVLVSLEFGRIEGIQASTTTATISGQTTFIYSSVSEVHPIYLNVSVVNCTAYRFSTSASGGNPPYQFYWSFGDQKSGSGKTVVHRYPAPGDYPLFVQVTDTPRLYWGPSYLYSETAVVVVPNSSC